LLGRVYNRREWVETDLEDRRGSKEQEENGGLRVFRTKLEKARDTWL